MYIYVYVYICMYMYIYVCIAGKLEYMVILRGLRLVGIENNETTCHKI